MKRIQRDERGVSIVLIAIALVALMAMAGLAIDGGRQYSNRRQVQNGADAAALAGTEALSQYVVGNESAVYNAVSARLTGNQANGAFVCNLVDQTGAVLQVCPQANGTPINANYDGVQVLAHGTQGATFTKAIGFNTLSAAGTATATMQRLISGSGPFLVCGVGATNPLSGGDGQDPAHTIITPTGGDTFTINNNVAPLGPVGLEFHLHGSNAGADRVPKCGANPGFKGVAGATDVFTPPADIPIATGDKAGPSRISVVGVCNDPDVVGCELVLPLCWNDPADSKALHCVAFGIFQVTYVDANTHRGIYKGTAAEVTGGQGGGKPVSGVPFMIRLLQ